MDKALQREPKCARCLFLYAVTLVNEGRNREGEDTLRRAMVFDPTNARYAYHLGVALLRDNRPKEAKPGIGKVDCSEAGLAGEFFGDGEARTSAAHVILGRLSDVGLGYLSLGQPLTTLSGGEQQRLKLATHMADKGGVYVLDEPTNGLHLADVEHLLGLLDRLVDSGKSVIVIEHHQAVMAHADWIIDLGPGAGHDGGRIVFEGTPADLVAARSTLTGEHLAAYVGT